MTLSSADVPQANDPERIVRLARHLAARGPADLPADLAHPRDRHFYLGALRTLRVLDADHTPTPALAALVSAADPRAGFAEVFAACPVGAAWLAWAGADTLGQLDPSSATPFLIAASMLSPSTAERRASTLRRWLGWCTGREAKQPAPATERTAEAASAPPPTVVEAAPVAPVEAPPPPPVRSSSAPRADANLLLTGLARAEPKLHLDTMDLCFIAALHLRGDRGELVSFDDEALMDTFETVCAMVERGAENVRKRATHAIQRLRDDRLLQRIDGSGLVRSGEYTLTGLAVAVVEFFIRDEALTKESLVLLTRVLHLGLAEVRQRAGTARGAAWRSDVVGPLTVTVRDLIDGIRRRQRGLDAQQEQVQADIAALLHKDWLDAVGRCERLLDDTSATLRELNEVLLRDTHQFVTVLQEIQGLASEAGASEAEEAAQRVIEQVDLIAAWGTARQRAWSDYYQYVHRFLQDVVRLDPDRALSQRLRDLITQFAGRPFGALVSAPPALKSMRPIEARALHVPVVREARPPAPPLSDVAPEDERQWLEERVLEALATGADTLSEVTARVISGLEEDERFSAAGRVTALVAELAHVTSPLQRPWVLVDGTIELGDWTIDGLREAP